jgi:Fe-S cluster biosynthesis and repair protein YggX
MSRTVYCQKLKKQTQGLDYLPYPGELGEKIYHHISKEAWEMWMNYQTRLINEFRLNLTELESQEFIKRETEHFLFEE